MKIYAVINGEIQEVIPFVWNDVGHSHVEMIGLISRENWDNIICDEKGFWEEVAKLSTTYYDKNDILRVE